MKVQNHKRVYEELKKAQKPQDVFKALKRLSEDTACNVRTVARMIEASAIGGKIDAIELNEERRGVSVLCVAWRYECGDWITCGAPMWEVLEIMKRDGDGLEVCIDSAFGTVEFCDTFSGSPYDLHESYFEIEETEKNEDGKKVYLGKYYHSNIWADFEYVDGVKDSLYFYIDNVKMNREEFANLIYCHTVTRFPAEKIAEEFSERLEIDTAE